MREMNKELTGPPEKGPAPPFYSSSPLIIVPSLTSAVCFAALTNCAQRPLQL